MLKYLKQKAKLGVIQHLEKKFVILAKKKNPPSRLHPWRENFLSIVDKKITDDVKTILEIGDGDGALSYHLSRKYRDRHFYGIDIGAASFKTHNYYHLNMSATEMLFHDDFFDLIISQNVFEHIQGLEKAVDEAVRILKPHGRLYTLFTPVWTSAFGHHLYTETNKKVRSDFPPFCHLYLNDRELTKLIKNKLGRFSKRRLKAEAYLLGEVNNKLLPDDYRRIFTQLDGMQMVKFKEITQHHHNDNLGDLPPKPLERYRALPPKDYYVVGFEYEGVKT